ncbi:MAG TPA: hypothetical protein VN495_00775 [Candidatus Paceibacterota bacterium]|nr:hypothetical protein [Candidatus Paceibacterota bacterium]
MARHVQEFVGSLRQRVVQPLTKEGSCMGLDLEHDPNDARAMRIVVGRGGLLFARVSVHQDEGGHEYAIVCTDMSADTRESFRTALDPLQVEFLPRDYFK